MKHGQKPKSEYGEMVAEKKVLKKTYGLREKQFSRYFKKKQNPESVFKALETRFDSVVFRCGFALSRKAARQLVSHGHMQINGANANLPSMQLAVNDVVSIHPSSLNIAPFKEISIILKKYEPPSWIALDKKNLTARIVALPVSDDPLLITSIKPVMELYSR